MSNALDKRHVLVTGGASGLGLGAVRCLLRNGADVVVADRNVALGQTVLQQLKPEFPGASIAFTQLDLSDPASVAACAQRMRESDRPLDGLINNAGIYPPNKRMLSPSGRELCFEIAFTGHFALTLQLLPLLESADDPRIVTVSSLVQQYASIHFDNLALEGIYTPIVAYAQAKLSNLLFALELQRRLEAAGMRTQSFAAHPGVVRTALGANRPQHADEKAWHRFRHWFLANGLASFGQSPESGARSLLAPLLDSGFKAGSFIGPGRLLNGFGAPVALRPGPQARDPNNAVRLWSLGEAATGLSFSDFTTRTRV